MKYKDDSGFSLVEFLITVGLLGVLFLVFMTLAKKINVEQSLVENKVSEASLHAEIGDLLKDPKNCTASFTDSLTRKAFAVDSNLTSLKRCNNNEWDKDNSKCNNATDVFKAGQYGKIVIDKFVLRQDIATSNYFLQVVVKRQGLTNQEGGNKSQLNFAEIPIVWNSTDPENTIPAVCSSYSQTTGSINRDSSLTLDKELRRDQALNYNCADANKWKLVESFSSPSDVEKCDVAANPSAFCRLDGKFSVAYPDNSLTTFCGIDNANIYSDLNVIGE